VAFVSFVADSHPNPVADAAFFYGTLMTGFDRRRRAGIESKLEYLGRGWIHGALFDLGIYPAAVPADDTRVWAKCAGFDDTASVLAAIDEIEGFSPRIPTTASMSGTGYPPRSKMGESWSMGLLLQRAARWRPAHRLGDYLSHVRVR